VQHGSADDVIDDRLLARLVLRAPAAWDTVVRAHDAALRKVAARIGLRQDDVEDVVQITWLRCLERIHTVRDPRALAGWLAGTCHREALRRKESLARQVPYDPTDDVSVQLLDPRTDGAAGDEPAERAARRDQVRRLYQAIADLPRRQRAVLMALLRSEGARYRATTERTGIPAGSLGPTRRRAIERLRRDPRLVQT